MILLSIDNDFFPWYGLDAKFRVRNMEGEWCDGFPGALVFDWGHGEGGVFRSDWIWEMRRLAFERIGLDLEREYNVRPEFGGVSYGDFASEVERRFAPTFLRIADSHMHGFDVARFAASVIGDGELEVVHFDAHHDLGYGAKAVKDHTAKGILDCGDWLYHALRLDVVAKATIVYPDWRKEQRPGAWLKPYRDRVEFTRWSRWLKATGDRPQRAAQIFTCRSAGWSPPYLDHHWLGLARRLNCGREPVRVDERDDCNVPRAWEKVAA